MRKQNLAVNIILGFGFFFIGRFIVNQMGNTGIWLILGIVVIFYATWWYFHKRDRNTQ